jgi:hypothetical protein
VEIKIKWIKRKQMTHENTYRGGKTLQLKTLDFLQQTITMNENVQWQMIKDLVLAYSL